MTAPTVAPVDTARPRPRVPLPDVGLALAAYVLTRLVGWVVISRAARDQLPSIWTGPRSGYLDLAQLWDAQWYKTIAVAGYPDGLPLGPTGAVQQNAWAFLPGFPMSTRAVMAVTGLDFGASAVLLNVVLGGCAVVVVHRLVRLLAGRGVALAAVVLLCTLPPAPVLQIAYSETLGLLLLALALLLLVERRYRWCAVVVLVLSLSRPVVAPFALVVLAHLVARWRARGREPFPRRQRVEVVGLGLLSAASSLLWPVLVGRLTGVPDAYQRTQGTWRSSGTVEPVTQTLGISRLLWGEHGPWLVLAGTLVLLAVVATPLGRPAGPELRTWSFVYPLYLAATLEPWTSTFRYLLLEWPLLVVLLARLRRVPLVLALLTAGLAVLGLVGQVQWVHHLLVFVPPTDYPP
ncbi:hypothetical protein [Angustibacter aerolatus]